MLETYPPMGLPATAVAWCREKFVLPLALPRFLLAAAYVPTRVVNTTEGAISECPLGFTCLQPSELGMHGSDRGAAVAAAAC